MNYRGICPVLKWKTKMTVYDLQVASYDDYQFKGYESYAVYLRREDAEALANAFADYVIEEINVIT